MQEVVGWLAVSWEKKFPQKKQALKMSTPDFVDEIESYFK